MYGFFSSSKKAQARMALEGFLNNPCDRTFNAYKDTFEEYIYQLSISDTTVKSIDDLQEWFVRTFDDMGLSKGIKLDGKSTEMLKTHLDAATKNLKLIRDELSCRFLKSKTSSSDASDEALQEQAAFNSMQGRIVTAIEFWSNQPSNAVQSKFVTMPCQLI